jgi:DNA replication protein DnaC
MFMKTISEILQYGFSDNYDYLCSGKLNKRGLSMFDTEVKLSEIGCEYCQGKKMYSCFLNDGSENSHKRIAFCVDPNCCRPRTKMQSKEANQSMEWTKLGFPDSHKGKNIKNYNFKSQESLEACKEFLSSKTWNIWFFGGDTGSGKTHMAQALAIQNYYTYQKIPLFVTNSTFYYEMMEAQKSGDQYRIMQKYATADFLVFDDLAAGKNTKYDKEIVYDLLARRISSVLKTIVTTNCSENQLLEDEVYGQRLKQRIANYGKWQRFIKPIQMPAIAI